MGAAKPLTTDRIVQEIIAGRHDEGLPTITEAIGLRALSGEIGMRWRITLDGLDVTSADITLEEAFRVQQLSGLGWNEIDPLASAAHARPLLMALLMERQGKSEDECVERFKTLTVDEWAEAVKQEVVKPADPLSPTTSTAS